MIFAVNLPHICRRLQASFIVRLYKDLIELFNSHSSCFFQGMEIRHFIYCIRIPSYTTRDVFQSRTVFWQPEIQCNLYLMWAHTKRFTLSSLCGARILHQNSLFRIEK